MRTPTVPPQIGDDEFLDAVLRQSHHDCMAEARRFLEPAFEQDADFWTRWAAVRYVADDFQAWHRREVELVEELRPLLPPDLADRLRLMGHHLSRQRLELDRVGRRRGTSAEFADRWKGFLTRVQRCL